MTTDSFPISISLYIHRLYTFYTPVYLDLPSCPGCLELKYISKPVLGLPEHWHLLLWTPHGHLAEAVQQSYLLASEHTSAPEGTSPTTTFKTACGGPLTVISLSPFPHCTEGKTSFGGPGEERACGQYQCSPSLSRLIAVVDKIILATFFFLIMCVDCTACILSQQRDPLLLFLGIMHSA